MLINFSFQIEFLTTIYAAGMYCKPTRTLEHIYRCFLAHRVCLLIHIEIVTFRGARDFFGSLNGTSNSEGHFGVKKSWGAPQKSRFCAKGPFWILESLAPFCDFQRVYFIISHHINSIGTSVILCHQFSTLFWGLFCFWFVQHPLPPHIRK